MLRELGLGAASIVGTALGMLVIAVFYQVAIDMADSWWTWIIGLAIATGLAVVAIGVIYLAMAATVAVSALGWSGMFAGRVPAGFGPGDRNLARAAGGLVLFGLSAWAGLALYRVGVRDGQLNWATEGTLLVGAGVLFGLGGALPRLYFAARAGGNPIEGRRARRKKKNKIEGSDDVAALFTLGVLGVALSMCTADSVVAMRARDGVMTMAYGEWADGCVARESITGECNPRAVLTLVPRRATRLRLEYIAKCDVQATTVSGAPIAMLGAGEMKRLGVDRGGGDERARRIFDATAGEGYRVTVEPKGSDTCFYSVRYFEEPSHP